MWANVWLVQTCIPQQSWDSYGSKSCILPPHWDSFNLVHQFNQSPNRMYVIFCDKQYRKASETVFLALLPPTSKIMLLEIYTLIISMYFPIYLRIYIFVGQKTYRFLCWRCILTWWHPLANNYILSSGTLTRSDITNETSLNFQCVFHFERTVWCIIKTV